MRSDVKVFLICLVVVVIFVAAYFVIVHHSKNSSRRIAAENVLPSQQPELTPTTPAPNNNAASPKAGPGGTANVPDNTNISSGTVPPATPGPTTPAGLGTNGPPTTIQGQVQPGGQITINSPTSPAAPTNTNNSANLDQGNSGTGNIGLNQGNTIGNTNTHGNTTGLAGPNGTTGSSGGHHARTYVIRHGDTLTAISQRIYGSARMVRSIERINPGVDPRRLRVGQKIKLPHSHALARQQTRHHARSRLAKRHGRMILHNNLVQRSRPLGRGSRIYVVRRGDTLIQIARREYHRAADWKLIYRANRRQIGSLPSDIRIGEKLVIPAR